MLFDQSTRHVSCDLEGLTDGSALGDEARNVVAGGEVDAFRQLFDMQANYAFHRRTIAQGHTAAQASRPTFFVAANGQLKALNVIRVKVSFTPESVWILLVTK